MIRNYMDMVAIVNKNDKPVIRPFVEVREPQVNKVGRRVCCLQVRETGVKRRSSKSAVFALRRNRAFANFSEIFVLKRQLYRHWIKYVDRRDCRHADTTDPSRAYRAKPVALNLCCAPLLMLFDIAILSKKLQGWKIYTKLWLPIDGKHGARGI